MSWCRHAQSPSGKPAPSPIWQRNPPFSCSWPDADRMYGKHIVAAALLLVLSACGTYQPEGLQIDRSIQAKSQNSRIEFIVLHYTSTGNEASLKILSEQNVSSHYLITNDPVPHIYQLVDENRRA